MVKYECSADIEFFSIVMRDRECCVSATPDLLIHITEVIYKGSDEIADCSKYFYSITTHT